MHYMCLDYGAEQRPDQSAQRHKSTHMRPVTDRRVTRRWGSEWKWWESGAAQKASRAVETRELRTRSERNRAEQFKPGRCGPERSWNQTVRNRAAPSVESDPESTPNSGSVWQMARDAARDGEEWDGVGWDGTRGDCVIWLWFRVVS